MKKKYIKVSSSQNYKYWKQLLKGCINNPVAFLEIGSYEGKSAIWFVENILTHPEAKIVCIDPWDKIENSYLENYEMTKVKENFIKNIEPYKDKIIPIEGFSFDVLCALNANVIIEDPRFNLIYIDGDHRTFPVLQDCVLAWPLLLKGGLMIFDDYMAATPACTIDKYPKLAIDNFLQTISGQYELVKASYQLVIIKK